MDDTSAAARERQRENLMSRTPEERARMASRMSMAARRLVESSVRAALGPDAGEREVRRGVFLRFYGRDLGLERAVAMCDAMERRRDAQSR